MATPDLPPRPPLRLVPSTPTPVSNLRLVVDNLAPLKRIPVLGRIS